MAKYFKDKNNVYVAPDNATDIFDQLPNKVYILKFSDMGGFYLSSTEDFVIPDYIYGSIESKVNKIIKTYKNRKTNTGVLLSGEKGSGKTMMSRLISINCMKQNIPTIIINTNFEEDFCKFISDINQECVIFFDEFEKVFKKDEQNKLLTLFDGTYTSNKLLLLTANDTYDINDFFMNRPGRVYYHIKFESLENSFICEYCEKNLNNKSYTESIINFSKLITSFNFDMLQAMVFECNLHEESPQQIFDMLNIKHMSYFDNYRFDIIDTLTNKKFTGHSKLKPFNSDWFYFTNYCDELYEGDDDPHIKLSEEYLVKATDGKYEFKYKNYKIFLSKADKKPFIFDF